MKADEIKITHKDKYTTTIELPRLYSNAEVFNTLKDLNDEGVMFCSGDQVDVLCEVCHSMYKSRYLCDNCKNYSEWQLHVPEQKTISLEDCK